LTPEEIAEQTRKAKFKKYGVLAGVYGAFILVLFILLMQLSGGDDDEASKGVPKLLLKHDIVDFISAKFKRDRNTVEAKKAINKALLALNRTHQPNYLYTAIHNFKLARAYGRVLKTNEERQFSRAIRSLTKTVQDKYYYAYGRARDNQLQTADTVFRELLRMLRLPSTERQEETNVLRENIMAHISYIKSKLNENLRG